MRGNLVYLAAVLLCLGAIPTKAYDRCNTSIGKPAPQALTISMTALNTTCYGGNNGAAGVIATGEAPYTYLWSNGKTTASIANLIAGTYSVTVTDANGDIEIGLVEVSQPGSPIVVYANCVATCPGVCAGTANLTVSGGLPPYTFMWSNGSTTEDVSGLCPGVYWVTITDANGCVKIKGLVVSETQGNIGVSGIVTNATCASPCGGSINITPSGTGPFTYAWSNGATTQDLTNLCPGAYSVTVTSTSGCGGTASFNVGGAAPLVVDATINDATACVINCDGSISLSVSGGTAPYIFLWSTGETTATVTDLCSGTYSVTITDAAGCVLSDNTTLFDLSCVPTDSCTLIAIAFTSGYSCDSACTGTATVVVPPFVVITSVLWSNGGTDYTIENLCSGVYTVTVTAQDGCTASATGQVDCDTTVVPCTWFIAAASYPDSNCGDGICDGMITLEINDATDPYSVMWSTGAMGDTLMNVCQGQYSFTVTDAAGCSFTTSVQISCNVTDTCYPIIYNAVVVDDSNCSDGVCDGSITLQIAGGTAPYTVTWANGAMGTELVNLCSGHYSYIITDAAGCIDGDIAEVECINVAPCDWFTVPLFQSDSDCSDTLCDGAIYLQVIGADSALYMGSYTIEWSNGVSGEFNDNLCAGVYGYTVTDGMCTVIDTLQVLCVPSSDLCADFSYTLLITPDSDCSDQVCDGTAIVLPTGGTAPYMFVSADFNSTGLATGLCAGYVFFGVVYDANECALNVSILIPCTEPCTMFIGDIYITPSQCDTSPCTGQIAIMPSGGTWPFTYAWGNGATTQDLSGLCPGSYEVVVTDSLGCTASSGPVVIVCQPGTCLLEVEVEAMFNDDCSDAICTGLVSLWTLNASMPISFSWSNGATSATATELCAGVYFYTVTDALGCAVIDSVEVGCDPLPCEITGPVGTVDVVNNAICGAGLPCTGAIIIAPFDSDSLTFVWNTGSTSNVLTSLCASIYSVTITADDGCTATLNIEVGCDSVVAGCNLIITGFGSMDGACADTLCEGAVWVTDVTGGEAPYTLLWSTGDTTSIVYDLCEGFYTVTVSDASGCSATTGYEVICVEDMCEDFYAFVLPLWDSDCTDGICDGSATLFINDNFPPYTYAWSTGDNTASVTGLCAGLVSVTITDAIGCTTEAANTLGCHPPCALDIELATQGSVCQDTVVIQVAGDSIAAPIYYWYLWTDGPTTSTIAVTESGQYCVTVGDDMGCTTSACMIISMVDVSATGGPENCPGACNGYALAWNLGGVEPVSYLWSNGDTTISSLFLCPGQYCVTMTDANGCTASDCVFVDSAPVTMPMVVTSTVVNSACTADLTDFCVGSITLNVVGGTAPYDFSWSNGVTNASATNLCYGLYDITIIDATGCNVVERQDTVLCLVPIQISLAPNNEPIALHSPIQANAMLAANPNPFNAKTTLSFSVPVDDLVSLEVFDMTGRLIDVLYRGAAKANEMYTADFNSNVGSGLYLYRLVTSTETRTGYLVQMK